MLDMQGFQEPAPRKCAASGSRAGEHSSAASLHWLRCIPSRQAAVLLVLGVTWPGVNGSVAQTLIQSSLPTMPVRLIHTDQAVLDLGEPKQDLPCMVTPIKPVLDFDMKFHAGYNVTVPLRELAVARNELTVIFRVRAEDGHDEPSYFQQQWQVPPLDEDAKGDVRLQGNFASGEGRFHVDWLMRDHDDRFCSDYWDFKAFLTPADRQMRLALAPATVQAEESETFQPEPPIASSAPAAGPGSDLKILIHVAALHTSSSVFQPADTQTLASTLRAIAREPAFRRFSLVAFDLHNLRVIYRQDYADHIDFPALGEALKLLSPGTVNVNALGRGHTETEFLTELIRQEMLTERKPDALIFLGPKFGLEKDISREALAEFGEPRYPVFYISYSLSPQASVWTDAISHTVRFFKGFEYTVSHPRDLWFAITQVLSRIDARQASQRAKR